MAAVKKILFLITDLRGGGAEKILVNIVNQFDFSRYEVTVLSIFKEGVNRQYLRLEVKQKWIFNKPFKGYSRLALLFSPEFLYRKFVKEEYDYVVSFLEGFPSRIASGGKKFGAKLISWIHLELYEDTIGYEFRNKKEARQCYAQFDKIICVAETVKNCFEECVPYPSSQLQVIYNPLDIKMIEDLGGQQNPYPQDNKLKLVSVGRLNPQKSYDRLLSILNRLKDTFTEFHLSILGMGPMQESLEKYIKDNHLEPWVTLEGYHENPYPYIKNADLFVCSSWKEGYSTVVTESVVLETPVVTTLCSGMKEILDNGNAGLIVENTEEALYEGLKKMVSDPQLLEHYRVKTKERSVIFKNRNSYRDIFEMLKSL